MEKQNRIPPRPGQNRPSSNANPNPNPNASAKEQEPPNRRRMFANRARTGSSGSTRGAFGPMPIVNSKTQHDEIYEMQQAAMHSNFHHINQPPVSHVHVEQQQQQQQRRGSVSKNNKQFEDLIVQDEDLIKMAERMTLMDLERGVAAGEGLSRGQVYPGGVGVYTGGRPPATSSTATNSNSNPSSSTSSPIRYKRSPSPHGNTRFFLSHHVDVNGNGHGHGHGHGGHQDLYHTNPQLYHAQQHHHQQQQHQHQQNLQYNANANAEIAKFSNMARNNNTDPNMEMNVLTHPSMQDYGSSHVQNVNMKTNHPHHRHPNNDDSIDSRRSDHDHYHYPYDDEEPQEVGFIQYYIKRFLFDPEKPEFDTSQQMIWAGVIGIFMGFFTAFWSALVEYLCEFFWVDVPEFLLRHEIFTDMDGYLPLPHYMWICPAIWGGILSYITALYEDDPIPGQNEWIDTLHRIGVMDHSKFFHMFILSTLGMASGLSLGPEMPLVVVAGMVGSYVALKTKQSVLSARVINLTAASAAIGGFFGFPMAGALFVLELPHRMGLQYFEALSPAVLSSIFAVIVNKMVTGKDVNGYFEYPFLDESLPNGVTAFALVYGVYGTFVGILYSDGVKGLKTWVHDWFHVHHDHDHDHDDNHHMHEEDEGGYHGEKAPLVQKGDYDAMEVQAAKTAPKSMGYWKSMTTRISNFFGIEHEPYRAAVAGVLAGVITGLICMFLPHQLFWGEAQLQTLIDRGRTPLPFFEPEGETSILTYYGYCMIDPEAGDEHGRFEGFSTACVGMLSLTKIITIGISLGTGICGGHFWGPLYVGCAASHFFTDVMTSLGSEYGINLCRLISEFPCVAMVCIMGCTHIVTYRCHIAIMLILTLTISTFSNQENGKGGGDYAAIFPLLVVACFVPIQCARNTVFYKQSSRGDIVAIPEVLCEPMKEGDVDEFQDEDDYGSGSYGSYGISDGESDDDDDNDEDGNVDDGMTSEDGDISLEEENKNNIIFETSDSPSNSGHVRKSSGNDPLAVSQHSMRSISSLSRRQGSVRSIGSRRPSLGSRTRSFGNVTEPQPELLNQARARAATNNSRSSTPVQDRDRPNLPPKGHKRKGSNISIRSIGGMDSSKHGSTT